MSDTMPNKAAPPKGDHYTVLEDGRWCFFFDSHTIGTLSQCEQLFEYKQMQWLRPKGPSGTALTIGSWWSAVLEDFYEAMRVGMPTKLDMILFCAKRWKEFNMDEMKNSHPKKYEKFAMPTNVSTVRAIVGQTEFGAALADVPLGPVLMGTRYYDTYAMHDATNWKIIGAEKGFGLLGEVFVGENHKVVVYYSGKPDLVAYIPADGVLAPIDHKTKDYITGDFDLLWKPHPQTAGYVYALRAIAKDLGYENVKIDRCIINGCARLEPAEPKKGNAPKPRFKRAYPHYTEDELEEWRVGIIRKATRLRHCIEQNEWLRNESACHIYAGCDFRRVCSQTPGSRDLVISADFTKIEPWVPYEVEEE